MARADLSLLQRVRPPRRLSAGTIALVLLLQLGLITAPAWSALRNECDLCPPTCPMHHPAAKAAKPANPHMHCHGTAKAAHPHGSELGPAPAKMARPPCGNHGVTTATVLPPVILTAAPVQHVVTLGAAAPPIQPQRCGRLADPPDTPPPRAAV